MGLSSRSLSLRWVVAASLMACGSFATDVSYRTLPPPEATHPIGFSHLFGFAEMANGIVLVTDPREGGVFALDAGLRTRRMVGGQGEGPLEYTSPGILHQFEADSAYQVDPLNRRWLVIGHDSVVAHTAVDSGSSPTLDLVLGADSLGRLLRMRTPRITAGGSTVSTTDSALLVRVNAHDARADTIARLRMSAPLDPGKEWGSFWDAEQAFLALDGWVAVVRREPYRVDWRSPEGRWTYGAPIIPGERPFGRAEREHFLANSVTTALGAGWEARMHWLPSVPAVGFQFSWRAATRDGHLVLKRQATVGVPDGTYDVIDRRGRVVDRLRLPPGSWILGFGAAHVYVVAEDEDGLQFLSKHPWRR